MSINKSSIMFVLLIALTACSRVITTIPVGIQTMTGVLLPTEISIIRRGTHTLTLPVGERYYVESKAVNLSRHEGQTVAVRGVIEPNADAASAPVLVTESVTPFAFAEARLVTLPALGVTLRVPKGWREDIQGSSARFSESGSLAASAILSIFLQSERDLAYDPRTLKLRTDSSRRPPGTELMPLLIGTLRAVHLSSSDGVESLHLATPLTAKRGSGLTVLTLLFRPHEPRTTSFDPTFMTVAHSVTFGAVTGTGSSLSSRSGVVGAYGHTPLLRTETGSLSHGVPCGGPAGILCAKGQFCVVTDRESNIGRCKKL